MLRRLHGGTLHDDGSVTLSDSAQVEFDAMQAAITWDQEHGQDKWAALWNTKAARYRSFVAITSQSWWGAYLRFPSLLCFCHVMGETRRGPGANPSGPPFCRNRVRRGGAQEFRQGRFKSSECPKQAVLLRTRGQRLG